MLRRRGREKRVVYRTVSIYSFGVSRYLICSCARIIHVISKSHIALTLTVFWIWGAKGSSSSLNFTQFARIQGHDTGQRAIIFSRNIGLRILLLLLRTDNNGNIANSSVLWTNLTEGIHSSRFVHFKVQRSSLCDDAANRNCTLGFRDFQSDVGSKSARSEIAILHRLIFLRDVRNRLRVDLPNN